MSESPFEIEICGPVDASITALAQQAFKSEHIPTSIGGAITFLESADPPVHIILNLSLAQLFSTIAASGAIGAITTSMLTELGKDLYGACKEMLKATGRAVANAYKAIKDQSDRISFYSLHANVEGTSYSYNIPGDDAEWALSLMPDHALAHRGDKSNEFFWHFGQWMTAEEFWENQERLAPDETANVVPTSEFILAGASWVDIVGRPPQFTALATKTDVTLDMSDLDADARRAVRDALRSALPHSTIGRGSENHQLFISNATEPMRE